MPLPPATIPFGEWLPDQPALGNPGATIATNVIPAANGYRSFPSLTLFSTSLSARCIGAIAARDADGTAYNYAGESAALRTLTGASWSASTRLSGGAYTTGTDDFWEFAQWGRTIIAVNGHTDTPQRISLGAANFANLSGIAMPKARHIAVIRDFVVLGNVSDSALGVARVRWSAFNSPFTTWSANPATLADYQDLATEGGWVQRIIGGEYGVVFQERAITRMQFVGPPTIFQFDTIHRTIGAYAPQAVCSYQNLVFFLAEDGFYRFDGINLTPIGQERVDRTFFESLDRSYLNRIVSVADPTSKCAIWAYPSVNANGVLDRLLIYSWAQDRWTDVEGIMVEYLWRSLTGGYDLDTGPDTNLDDDTYPALDSRFWTANQNPLTAFKTDHTMALFNGSAMPATITTGEFQPYRQVDGLAYITQLRPLVEADASLDVTVTLTTRNRLDVSGSSVVALAEASRGTALVRRTGRYHRVTAQTSADFEHALGFEVIAEPAGRR